jgi:hypothetical protein
MKAKKIIATGVTTMVILKVLFSRFIRLLRGEQITDFLTRIGRPNDIALMGLANIVFVALFSFLKRVRVLSIKRIRSRQHK